MIDALSGLLSTPWIAATLAGSTSLVVGVAAGVAGVRQRSIRQARTQAEDLLVALERALRGEPREAFEALRREAARPDAPPALYFALAAALRQMGMTERSAQVHRGLLARGGLRKADKVRAQLGLAVDYLQLGRPGLAYDLIKSLPRGVRNHRDLLAVRRLTAIEAKDWKEAIESTTLMVRRGVQSKSEIADVHARMGQESLSRSENKAALRSFKRALRRDVDNQRARLGLAQLYQSEGKSGRARKHLIRCVEQNPGLAPLILRTIRDTFDLTTLRDRQKYASFLERLSREEDAAMWIALEEVELFIEASKLEAAERLLSDLLKRYPNAFEVHMAWVEFLADTQREDESLRYMHTLLELAERQIQRYRCTSCGFLAPESFLDCPRCGRFGQLGYYVGAEG